MLTQSVRDFGWCLERSRVVLTRRRSGSYRLPLRASGRTCCPERRYLYVAFGVPRQWHIEVGAGTDCIDAGLAHPGSQVARSITWNPAFTCRPVRLSGRYSHGCCRSGWPSWKSTGLPLLSGQILRSEHLVQTLSGPKGPGGVGATDAHAIRLMAALALAASRLEALLAKAHWTIRTDCGKAST